MSPDWYALRVKPHKETSVYGLLRAKKIDAFYPCVQVTPVNPRSARQRPYFPGYIFVQVDLQDTGINTFSWLPGTRGLVNFGGDPAVIPPNLITELKQRMATINANGGLYYEDLKEGDRVRITDGPFAGYEAIFDMRLSGKDRVQVLLAFLSSHPHKVKINPAYIEKLK